MHDLEVVLSEALLGDETSLAASGFRITKHPRPEKSRALALIAAAAIGNLASVNTMLTYTMGVFIGALQQSFGWSRAKISISMTCYTAVAFLGTALIGRYADRFNPGRLATVSMVIFGGTLLLVPLLVQSVTSLWLAYFLLALAGLGTSTAVMNKPIVASFSQRRGLAIGLALMGGGLGGFVLPPLVTALIRAGGWQLGYEGLGALALLTAPVLWLVIGRRSSGRSLVDGRQDFEGLEFTSALKSKALWMLSAIALFGGLGMSGPVAHLVPFLRDHGASPAEAAGLAALLGVGGMLGRIITGVTLDRCKGPFPGMPLIGVGTVGLALLELYDIRAAAFSIVMLGFVVGSELDLLAYFASRFLGLRAHATVFGWTYGMVALGASAGPVALGALRDAQATYALGLWLSSACLLIAAVLCIGLGRYRYSVE